MLPPVSVLSANLMALAPSPIQAVAVMNFVDVVCDYIDMVQASPLGSPGILTTNRPIFAQTLQMQMPVPGPAWISNFVLAFQQGVSLGIITPGTVTNPVWLGSGVDVLTLPTPIATIVTLELATSLLQVGLLNVSAAPGAPMPLAQAISDAVMAFSFLCIGLGPPPAFPPIPLPLPAV